MELELFVLDYNTWNHLTVYKQISSGSFKSNVTYKLFTYKLCVYVYILVWFYGISTIVGCLMPNPLYAYILNVYDL